MKVEAVIFKHDVMHCGSSYSTKNTRIYFKATQKDKECPSQDVASSITYDWICKYCQASMPKDVGKHHISGKCPGWLTPQQIEAKAQKKRDYSNNCYASKKKHQNWENKFYLEVG